MAKKQPDFSHFETLKQELGADASAGFEDVNMATMAIPFIKILQDTSPQVKKKNAAYIPGAEAGMLYNSVTKRLYEAPIRFVVGKFERYYIEWKPERGPFVASHLPEEVENKMMRTLVRDENFKLYHPETKNTFVDTYIYYVLFPDYLEDGICIFSFSSTQIKEAKKLNRMMMNTRIPGTNQKALPYFMIWSLEVVEESNDKGSWCAPLITLDETKFVTPALLAEVTEERAAIPNKVVDLTQLTDDAGKTSSSDDSSPKY